MPTRNVVLTAHQNQLIDQWVAAGRYQNASEILREGLRLIEQREAVYQIKLQALRQAAQAGIDDIEAGRFQSFDSAESLQADLDALTEEVLGSSQNNTAPHD